MTGFVEQARALVGLVQALRAPGQLSVMTGVRTTAAVLVPLIVGQLAHHPAVGLMAGIGGLNVAMADTGGPYRVKAITMGIAMISLATAALLGTVVGGLSWLALPLVFLVACVGGLAGVFGNAAAKVSFLSLVLFALMVGVPAGFVGGLERCAAFIGGGLWAMVLSLWLWPLRPYQPVREAVAACYQALSALIDGTCRAHTGQGAGASGLAASSTPARAAVVAALGQARGMVVAVRAAREGMSPVGQGLLVQLRRADALFDAVIALAETLETVSQHPRYARVRAEVDHAVHQLAVTVAALATAIRQGHDRLDLAALDQAVAAVSDRVLTRPQRWQHPAEDSIGGIDLYNIAGALQTVTARVRAAAETLTQHGELRVVEPPPTAGSQPRRAGLRAVAGLLRDNFTFRSLAFRHALRLGVTTMAAVVLYTVLGLPHGVWVTLTILVILKPNFGGTYQQAVQRVSGTVAGSVMGAILAAAVIKPLFLDLLLIPLGILAFAVMASHYGLGVLFLTPFVVVLLNTVQPGDWELAAFRSLDTIVGGLLALLAGYLLWPSWERERLPEQLARTITANLDYFRSVMSGYLGGPGDLAAMRARRAQAQVENTNAAAAFQRLLSEPMIPHGPVAPMYTLVTYNQRFYDGVTTLAVGQSNGNGRHVLPGIDRFAMQVDRALQDLAQAVRSGRRAAALPSFDASLGATHAYVHELMTAHAAAPATERPSEFDHGAVHGIAALSAELDRLADEVLEMSKAVERAEAPDSNPAKRGTLSESGA